MKPTPKVDKKKVCCGSLTEMKDFSIDNDSPSCGDIYYDTKYKVCRHVSTVYFNDGSAMCVGGPEEEDGYDYDGEFIMNDAEQFEGTERYLLLFCKKQGLLASTMKKIVKDFTHSTNK